MTCFFDGNYVNANEVFLSPFDLGFQRGLTIFEAFRTYNKTLLFLEKRLRRLSQSAKELAIELPEKIEDILNHLIETSPYSELEIKIYATPSTFIVLTEPFTPFSSEYFEKGIEAITLPATRPIPTVKTTAYAASIVALEKANAAEGLYKKENGDLLEGSRSSLFVVQNKRLITPPLGEILPGITRDIILSFMQADFTYPNIAGIADWEEAFLTSSIRGIVPLVSVNGTPIGNGVPGKMTKEVIRLFELTLEKALHKATFCFNRIESNLKLH